MPEYKIWLDSPTLSFHAAVQNLGGAIHNKTGVFTVRLLDEHLTPLVPDDCNLSVSKQLGECFVYVSATPRGGLISIGTISASKPFQGAEIRYEGVYTDQPLTTAQLGPIFVSTQVKEQQGGEFRTVTRLARPRTGMKENGK
jgi:hypothetical protein